MVAEQAVVALAFGLVLTTFSSYVGVLLLRLRPPDRARTYLAWALCLAPMSAFFSLRALWPSPFDALWTTLLVVGVGAAWMLGILFVANFPSPMRWRSATGALVAFALAFGAITSCLDLYDNFVARVQTPEWFDFGAYSWERGMLLALVMVGAAARVRELPDAQRRVAVRVLVAFNGGAFLFTGYAAIQHLNLALHEPLDPLKARYQLLGFASADAYDVFVRYVAQPFTTAGLFAVFAVGHKDRLAWALAGVGVLAFLLDQLNRHDIIDLGVLSLIGPAVILREATRHGALGVRTVPARLGLPVAAAAGFALLLAVLALASMLAADQPLVMTLALLAGLAGGIGLTYALRPRGITLTITREGSPDPRRPAGMMPGERVAGRYLLERQLGSGGQGDAWLARDERIHRPVVLKSVLPEGVREARLAGALSHPHVVTVHDVVEATGATFLVLEYVEGGDLRGVLARRGALPPREADALFAGILEGLDAVHARGIVHGDLKPENVLLNERGEAKLADFGIARQGASQTVVAGAGTLAYMAPEQMRGLAPTPQSDLYAAALLYREMLTGEPPAPRGLDDVQLRALIAQREAPEAEATDARDAILRRALARDPAARYASAREMLDALSAAG